MGQPLAQLSLSWLIVAPALALAEKPLGPPDYTKISGFVAGAKVPMEEPILLWKVTAATVIRGNGKGEVVGLSNPVTADGVVYFGDDLGRLFALDAADGTELWVHEHGKRISVEPSLDAEHIYFGSELGITTIRRDNGQLVWRHLVQHGANETMPLPIGNRVYASAYDGVSYALERSTGKVIWQHDFAADAPADQPGFEGQRARLGGKPARPRGAACDGTIFVQGVFDQSRYIAVDCQTGQRRWSFQAGGWTSAAPTIVKDRVYVNSQDKNVYCLDRETGKLLWKYQTPSWLASQPAVHNGIVFQPGSKGRLYQLDADSGRLIQAFEPVDEADRQGTAYSFPLIDDVTACFATGRTGLLYAVDVATGKLRWKLRPADKSELFTDPVTDGQRIFVVSRQDINKAGETAIFAIGPSQP
jgi:outer membrane protein assembly factor BamB